MKQVGNKDVEGYWIGLINLAEDQVSLSLCLDQAIIENIGILNYGQKQLNVKIKDSGDYQILYRLLAESQRIESLCLFGKDIYKIDRMSLLRYGVCEGDKKLWKTKVLASGDFVRSHVLQPDGSVKRGEFRYDTKEIEKFFKKYGIPEGMHGIDPGVMIVDTELFVKSGIDSLKNGNGTSTDSLVWLRLQKFINQIKQSHARKT
jgi:hypothetical protein